MSTHMILHVRKVKNSSPLTCSTLNALWLPVNLERRHPDFQRAYDLLEVDKKQILGNNLLVWDETNLNGTEIHLHSNYCMGQNVLPLILYNKFLMAL